VNFKKNENKKTTSKKKEENRQELLGVKDELTKKNKQDISCRK